MPCKLLAIENTENCIHLRDTSVCDPGALPDSRDTEMKENACPAEAYSLGVALENSVVHPFLVYLDKHFNLPLVEIIEQPLDILKSKVWYTFFFLSKKLMFFKIVVFVSAAIHVCKVMGRFSSSIPPWMKALKLPVPG